MTRSRTFTEPVGVRHAHAVATTLLLVTGSLAFRVPPLLNARSTNSDAAVVGLQAMHLLRGEWSPFLWGSGYQTSADSFVAAAFFALLGPSPLALMLSALSLHVLATWLVFATLRRHFSPWPALLLVAPLILSPSSVHSYALYPPRQASLTLALAALWAVDAAGARLLRSEARTCAWLVFGGLLATLAVSADPYPLLVLPLTATLAFLVASTGAHLRDALVRFGAFGLGAALGLVPFVVLHRLAGAKSGPMSFTTAMLGHHFELLARDCLPWALSYKVFYAHHVMDYRAWDAPLAFRILGIAGALLLGAMVVFALVAARARSLPWPVRRLGLIGGLAFPLAIAGFMISVMVMDHFSMRYLVVLTLLTPLAAAPAARALGTSRFAIAFTPHLVAAAVAGWVGYGPFVRGAIPVREAPELRDDYTLFHLLRARGLRYATADYWTSYRLTFLFREEIVVVPSNAAEDRYAPYRLAFDAEPSFAYVFDPARSRENLAETERDLMASNTRVERLNAGELTVLVVTRTP